jgi:hypothetical protein
MFKDEPDAAEKAAAVVEFLSSHDLHRAHGRHLHRQELAAKGLKIAELGSNPALQDAVLTVHHACMLTVGNNPTNKLIENHKGVTHAKIVQIVQQAIQIPITPSAPQIPQPLPTQPVPEPTPAPPPEQPPPAPSDRDAHPSADADALETAAKALFDATGSNHPQGLIPKWEDQPEMIKQGFRDRVRSS